jgi:hypothetical protein
LRGRLLAFGLIAVAVAGAYVYGRFRGADRAGAQADQGGYVGFEPAQIDLGDQLWAQVVPVTLTFVNRGTSGLTIESAHSSCDCTVIEGGAFQGRAVTPGESLPVDVKLDTQKSPGLKARRIDLTAASGVRYSAVIRVNVVGTWSITPDALDFGEVVLDDGEDDPRATVLYESDTDNLLDISTSGAAWIEVQPNPADQGRIEILVRLVKARLAAGQNSASLVVGTDCALKPSAVVFLKARGVHELAISPTQVLLVGTKPVRVECFDRTGARVRLVSADAASGAIRVDVLPNGAIEILNSTTGPLPEPIAVRVVDDRGRSRVFPVSAS